MRDTGGDIEKKKREKRKFKKNIKDDTTKRRLNRISKSLRLFFKNFLCTRARVSVCVCVLVLINITKKKDLLSLSKALHKFVKYRFYIALIVNDVIDSSRTRNRILEPVEITIIID